MRRFLFPIFALAMAAGTAQPPQRLARKPEARSLCDCPAGHDRRRAGLHRGPCPAAERLIPGSFVKPGALRWQKWPDVEISESYLVRGRDDETAFEGSVVRQVLTPGDPILAATLIRPGDRGFLAAVLDPDMRAVSVPVDEASSNAGLIFPGDRVDLILTQSISAQQSSSNDGEPNSTRRVSETVLENLRVIAMGRRLHTDPERISATRRCAPSPSR
jgi:Flp pilus assembly protein CpaB